MEAEQNVPSLRSPLLLPIRASEADTFSHGEPPHEASLFCSDHPEILSELRRLLRLAAPLIAVSLLQYSLQVISIMFVGHLGELALSGASMAVSFANVSGFSVMLGMGSALDTLCGQAYGAKQYHMLGIHTQRAMLVLILVSIPLALVWACTGQILMASGQNPEISREAGIFACYLIPGLFAYGLLQSLVRFLQTQNIVFPMLVSSGVSTLFHVVLCWILVYNSGLGNKSAALATAISYWINVLILAVHVNFSQACKKTWTGFSKEALYGILQFLRLAISSALMICLEYWSFEMVVLLSGLLPNPKLETSVLSISIRVSNELGAGHAQSARLSVHAVIIIVIAEGMVVALVSILVRHVWGYLYSNEQEVVDCMSMMMPILAISDFLDGAQCALSGAARGCGRQKICSIINLGAYYGIGIPSAILFSFVLHIGGQGLWMGIVCALIVQLSVLLVMFLCIDWVKEVRMARDRILSSAIISEAIG